METIIKIKPEELTHSLIDKIKSYLPRDKDFEITINLTEKLSESFILEEPKEEYTKSLNTSINEMKEGKVVSFSMKGFEEYINNNFSS